ncbi:MAG: integrin, partial [Burkholderiales bacterium]|nr:integrin [Burkholderiales bacterium]
MPGAGAVYVFVRVGGVWSQQAYIKASNTKAGDNFGLSVSLSGDSLAVGAWLEDSFSTGVNGDQSSTFACNSGAAYV